MQHMRQSTPISAQERLEQRQRREERDAEIAIRNKRLGLFIFQISWIMAFISLVIVNFWFRARPDWNPMPPNWIVPSLATLGLLASSILAHRAMNAIAADERPRFFSQWMAAIVLAAIFVLVMVYQFFAVPDDGGLFVMTWRLMIGYHAVHALVVLLMMVRIHRFARYGLYQAGDTWPVESTAKLWHFVTVAWILFYLVLYLI